MPPRPDRLLLRPHALGARRLECPCAAATAALLEEGPWPLAPLGPGHLETRLSLTHQLLDVPEALGPLELHNKHYHPLLPLSLPSLGKRALAEPSIAPFPFRSRSFLNVSPPESFFGELTITLRSWRGSGRRLGGDPWPSGLRPNPAFKGCLARFCSPSLILTNYRFLTLNVRVDLRRFLQ